MKRTNQFHRGGGLNHKVEQLESRELLATDVSVTPLFEQMLLGESSTETTLSSEDPSNIELLAAFIRSVLNQVANAEARSFDGSGNNLANVELGSTGQQLLRVAPAEYSDGVSSPAGEDRPSAREISNALVAQESETTSDRQLSAFIYAWGQFIDHDIDLTEIGQELFPIEVPPGDPFFDPDNTGSETIRLTRSVFDESTGTSVENPRQQLNQITAWIDGSMVYGSDQTTADSLRTFENGMLRVSEGDLPPMDADGNFVAGDIRANENVELTSLHTLFIREHNWWAEQIAQQDSSLGDEEIYQQARAIVIAEIQSITFNEFLPALLGEGIITPYQGYDPSVDPSVANEFSTAGFRLHTFINDDVEFFGNDGRAVAEAVELAEAFNNPALLVENGADSILKYLASSQAQEFDTQIVDSLRNFLFGQPGDGGFDLASLNIQRGRDHGLADYNTVREAYGLEWVEAFDDITSDPEVQQQLEELYGTVDNIDLWVGALAEDHVTGSSVGELVQAIVADQFERLRDADRLWYENVFSNRALEQIQGTSLSDIITRNTSIDNLQGNVFFMRAELVGEVFVDSNANGQQDRREQGLSGVTVELLDDEGIVIATTITNSRGRYEFDNFRETGDYKVRVVIPDRYQATTTETEDVLVSRGDESVSGVDFGLQTLRSVVDGSRDRDRQSRRERLAALDAALDDEESIDSFTESDSSESERGERSRRGG